MHNMYHMYNISTYPMFIDLVKQMYEMHRLGYSISTNNNEHFSVKYFRGQQGYSYINVKFIDSPDGLSEEAFHISLTDIEYYRKFIPKTDNNRLSYHNDSTIINTGNEYSFLDIEHVSYLPVIHTNSIQLQYPVHEDEYFQQLTLMDLPSPEDIDTIMRVNKEILGISTDIKRVELQISNKFSSTESVQFMAQNVIQILESYM